MALVDMKAAALLVREQGLDQGTASIMSTSLLGFGQIGDEINRLGSCSTLV